MSRVLGLDPGERRVGVAISDESATIAFPFAVLDATPLEQLADALRRCCNENNVARIVVGLPVRTDGVEGEAAQRARAFARWAGEVTQRPVELWDERFTTLTAEQTLIEAGVRRRDRRGVVDKLAAQILLQHYLDARCPPPASAPAASEED